MSNSIRAQELRSGIQKMKNELDALANDEKVRGALHAIRAIGKEGRSGPVIVQLQIPTMQGFPGTVTIENVEVPRDVAEEMLQRMIR